MARLWGFSRSTIPQTASGSATPGPCVGARTATYGARTAGAISPPGPALAAPSSDEAMCAALRPDSVMVAAETGTLLFPAAVGKPCVGLYGETCGARNG